MQEFIQKLKMKKGLLITVFLLTMFVLAIVIWYSPIIFKGYPALGVPQDMLLARNYYQTGVLAAYNNQSILLASSLIAKEGQPFLFSKYLGDFFYSKIFKITGLPDYNGLNLISIILYALALVFFTILILKLFNFKVAIIFSLIYIFSPIGWSLAQSVGKYEFCLIFWALFFIFYFLGAKKTEPPKNKFNYLFLVMAGICLTLAAFSAETTLVFALAFFIFLAVQKLKYQLFCVFTPFIILLAIFWLPSFLSGENRYVSLITNRPAKASTALAQLHVFPDPYTYYFAKEEFLEKFKNQELGWTEDLQTKKDLTSLGFEKISLFERVNVGGFILFTHLTKFFSLEDFGGPLFLLLWILGLIYLRREKVFLFKLFIYWLGISFFIFSFVILVGRNHLMDFIWLLILGVALGLQHLLQLVKDHWQLKNKKAVILEVLVIGLVLYNLLLVNHVVLGRQYDEDTVPRSIAYANEIKKFKISDEEVIAVPGGFEVTLNYLTDKSFVIFRSSTLNQLLKEGKVKQAFEAFGVKYILGYEKDLSQQLTDQAPVVNIADSSLAIEMGAVSENKSFFMNIIR